jgi:thiamine biosynthesis lipoprotein
MQSASFRHRRALLRAGLATCGVVAFAGIAGQRYLAPPFGQYRFSGDIMGTIYNVSFVAPLKEEALRAAARDAVHAALTAVDGRMSTFKATSELTALNLHKRKTAYRVSEDTLAVVRAAQHISVVSGGAFDITAGPLVNAWGFGPRKDARVPAAAELARLRKQVGYRLLALDEGEHTITKLHPDMYVDLSSIAKGYGVDVAARALDGLGIDRYVVEVGGEVRARGRNVHGAPWQVAIEEPHAGPRAARTIVPLEGMAMATSGDYRIYFERSGRRYSHEIDPVSASPVSHALTSVTVIARDCCIADACATALMVLGPDKGYALAEKLALGAYFITRTPDGGLQDRTTAAFSALQPRPAHTT